MLVSGLLAHPICTKRQRLIVPLQKTDERQGDKMLTRVSANFVRAKRKKIPLASQNKGLKSKAIIFQGVRNNFPLA
ncbi:MAG: hypothetical protein CRN43_02595 [Candidatus Nephrothrix sp. EaCA]|nr:MAG: hypothetical protein CRN43_02595 [Candidatus Nephrothrix sp. EaCA]